LSEFFGVFTEDNFFTLLLQHVWLSAAALAIGCLVALPVAVLTYRRPFWSAVAENTGNVGRAIPSLALIAFVFPFTGFGFDTALFALTLLAIPPILINAATGLRQVEPRVVDAAKGMGLSEGQILRGVRLPIAAPVIFAGLRVSAVQVVASATLATFVGGGALGDLIVGAFSSGSFPTLFASTLVVAALAIAADLGFGGLERAFTPKGLRIARERAAVNRKKR
jgi:osmoprotectant transport system permease protein